MDHCLYCDQAVEKFTREHVLPQALGGNLREVNPFVVNNVCQRCNTTAGKYIDGPFIRSWLIHNYRATRTLEYVDLSAKPILPLTYVGVVKDLTLDDRVCDFWLGPAGDRIYHFHRPYPVDVDSGPVVGAPPHIRRGELDPGIVFLFLRPTNHEWIVTVLRSCAKHFSGSALYLGNSNPVGPFKQIPSAFNALHSRLQELNGQEHEILVSSTMFLGDRFLGKLALGIGAITLGQEYASSRSATKLRDVMWGRTFEQRQSVPLHGSAFLSGKLDEQLIEYLSWSHGHTLWMTTLKERVALVAIIYGTLAAVIEVSDDPSDVAKIPEGGLLYVVSPGICRHAGPVSLEDLIAHKYGNLPNYQLARLESWEKQAARTLPPIDA